MKAIRLSAPWEISCINVEKPVPKEDEATDSNHGGRNLR